MRADADEGELLAGRRAVVTGGSLGIGAAITRGLLARGAEVLVACRDVARAEARRRALAPAGAGSRLSIRRLDVSSLGEVRAFAAELAGLWPRVDVLVHNAGASFARRRLSVDGHELTFATNVLGSYALTRGLRPLLRRAEGSARVVHVGSAAQYLSPLRSERLLDVRGPHVHEWVYAQSKRALFELSERWAAELDEEGITSTCAHPGLVATPGVADAFPRYHRAVGRWLPSADVGADTTIWLASSPAVAGSTGGLWWRRARQPSDVVAWTRSSEVERDRLWRLCARLTDASIAASAGSSDGDESAIRALQRAALARAPLFAGLRPRARERLAAAGTLRRFAAGEVIALDRSLSLILTGSIVVDDPRGPRTLGPEDCLDDGSRAHARAATDVTLLVFVGPALAELQALRAAASGLRVEVDEVAPSRSVVIENCTDLPIAALERVVGRALAGRDGSGPRPIALHDHVAAPPGATHLRFLDGGAARSTSPQPAPGSSFDVWVGAPGPMRRPGDLVLPRAAVLTRYADEATPEVSAALGRLARAISGRRVGVALSGGGAWGFAHLALLRALDDAGVPIDVIAGSSLGVAVGGLYALRGAAGLDALLAAHRRIHLAAALSVVSSAAIERVIVDLVGDTDVAELGVNGPLLVALTVDLVAGAEHCVRHGPLAVATRASCGFPGVYGPTLAEGRRLVDGAFADNVPIDALKAEGADLIIAANTFVAPPRARAEPPRGRLGTALATIDPIARLADAGRSALVLGSSISAHLARDADVVFAPDLRPFRLTDWHRAHAIVDRAAAAARIAATAAAARFAAL